MLEGAVGIGGGADTSFCVIGAVTVGAETEADVEGWGGSVEAPFGSSRILPGLWFPTLL